MFGNKNSILLKTKKNYWRIIRVKLFCLKCVYKVGEPENRCAEGEFQCAIGDCIMGYKRCNGIKDCPSGNDEVGCQDIGGRSLILQHKHKMETFNQINFRNVFSYFFNFFPYFLKF